MYTTEETINTSVATIAATDEILAQVRTTLNRQGGILYTDAVRSKPTREAITATRTPFVLLRIVDEAAFKVGTTNGSFTRVIDRVELALSIIFSCPPKWNGQDTDIQAIGSGLRDATLRVLEVQIPGNPQGFVRTAPVFWEFSDNTDFKAKLTRGVTRFDVTEKLTDPLYTIPIQFKIDVHPQRYVTLYGNQS